jgi:hypothetical protein
MQQALQSLKNLFGPRSADELYEDMLSFSAWAVQLYNEDFVPWRDFIGVGLKPPQPNYRHIEQRVLTNITDYKVNYAIVCAVVFVLRLIFSPFLLLSAIVITALSIFVLCVYKKPVIVFDVMLSPMHKRIGLSVFAVLLLFITGTLEKLIWTAIFCVVLCGVHLLGRPRSVTPRTSSYDVKVAYTAPGSSTFDPESGGDNTRRYV